MTVFVRASTGIVAAVMLQMFSGSASAAEDLTAAEVSLQLEVFLNGEPLNLIAPFRLLPGGQLLASVDELRELGLDVPVDPDGPAEVRLEDLEGVTYRYDEASQSIHIVSEPERLLLREYGMPALRTLAPTRPPFGVTVNYSLYVSGSEKATEGRFYDGLRGLFEARVFGRFGLMESSQTASWGPDGDTDIIRLDSRFIFEEPQRLRTLVIGDTVSGGLAWSRPVRMAGVQLRRAFEQRPDLVTVPVAKFSGTAAVPTTAELLVNQRSVLKVETPPGPYLIGVPASAYGQGNATLVLTDPAGQRFVASMPFYGSPLLLAEGLTDYTLEAGVARRNFGVLSEDYDDAPFVSGTLRRGLTDAITAQGHFEAADGLTMAGAGAVFNVRNQFLLQASAAASSGPRGEGGLAEVAFERRTRHYGIYLRSQRTWGEFSDLASHTAVRGDASFNDFVRPPVRLDQASAWVSLPRGASVWANYFSVSRRSSESRIASLGFNRDFGRFLFYANAAYDFGGDGEASVFVGLSMPLGNRGYAAVGAAKARNETYGFVEASRWHSNETGDWGAAARLVAGDREDASLRLGYLARAAELEVLVEAIDGQASASARASGAIGFVAGGWNIGRRSFDSYAIVDVGYPDVPVLYENRHIGRTGPRGRLVIHNLTAFSPNRITVDPTQLPLDLELAANEVFVAPYSRVPVLVDFNVTTIRNTALVTFVDTSQTPLPAGSIIARAGDSETSVVGYDGEAWLADLGENNTFIITRPNNTRCEASFAYQHRDGVQARIGPVVCRAIDTGPL